VSTYAAGNLAWQLGGDARLVRELAADSDVLALVECRTRENEPVDVAAILGDSWRVWQDTSSGARSGTAIAVRKVSDVKVRRAQRLSELVRVSIGTSKVQARYLRRVKLRDSEGKLTVMAVHIPLASTGLQDEAMRETQHAWSRTRGRRVLFADGNMPPVVFAAQIGAAHFSGSGVMCAAWSRGWDSVKTRWFALVGSDHKTVRFSEA
jgi:hypothetical protein